MGSSLQINETRLRNLLMDLIKIKSVCGEEGDIVDYLMDSLAQIADRVEHQPVRDCGGNVLAYFGGSRSPSLLLLTHMDTVELFSGWTRSPWGEEEDGVIYGLGALDSKSSLAAMIEAVRQASSSGLLREGVLLAAVCDEEKFSRGTYELIRSGKLSSVERALVGEPTDLRVATGAYGRIVFEIEVRGRAALDIEEGVNAIVEAAKLVRWSVESSGGEIVAPIGIRSPEFVVTHPDLCVVKLDVHYPPGESEESIRRRVPARLRKTPNLLASLKISPVKRPTPFLRPFGLPEDAGIVGEVSRAFRLALGRAPEFFVMKSVTDANYLNNLAGIPSVVLGPSGGNQHSPDEHVIFSSVVDMARLLLALVSGGGK
ncbi:MAG: hypothetical protein DRO06_03520 [Thermoproteota archaeon]|nr:MAG: hypothetical protein DRO06_03520 [Candidatus Korarchaeota archaeon]